jgi:hypothetical protein
MLLKKCTLVAALYLLHASLINAQRLRYAATMPSIALGAYSTRQSDAFAFTGNPAALAQQKIMAAGVCAERRFLLSATSTYRAVVALPTRLGHFGLQLDRGGFDHFSENTLGLVYARSLGRQIDLGLQFNYYGYRVPAYGNASTVGMALGALLHLTDRLHAGVAVCNPIGAAFSKAPDEKMATALRLGMGYEASDHLLLTAELLKEEGRGLHITVGAQYQLGQHFFARAGFVSANGQPAVQTGTGFAGLGLGWQRWRLHLTGSWHPQLGPSPALVFLVHFTQTDR